MKTEVESISRGWFSTEELSALLNWSILRNMQWHMQTLSISH